MLRVDFLFIDTPAAIEFELPTAENTYTIPLNKINHKA